MRKKYISPIIVIGCHRSGTSLMSEILIKSGIFMGAFLDNHSESKYYIKLNEALFSEAGATWDRPEPLLKRLGDLRFQEKALTWLQAKLASFNYIKGHWGIRTYLRKCFAKSFAWGWKDPRNTITLPLWLAVYPNAKVIHVSRNGVDVARSLKTREERRNPNSPLASLRCLQLDQAFELWAEYEEAAIEFTKELTTDQFIRFRYEDYLLKPKQHQSRITDFLGVELISPFLNIAPTLKTTRAYSFLRDENLNDFYQERRQHPIMVILGYNEIY